MEPDFSIEVNGTTHAWDKGVADLVYTIHWMSERQLASRYLGASLLTDLEKYRQAGRILPLGRVELKSPFKTIDMKKYDVSAVNETSWKLALVPDEQRKSFNVFLYTEGRVHKIIYFDFVKKNNFACAIDPFSMFGGNSPNYGYDRKSFFNMIELTPNIAIDTPDIPVEDFRDLTHSPQTF